MSTGPHTHFFLKNHTAAQAGEPANTTTSTALLFTAAAVLLAAMDPAQKAKRQTIFDFDVLDAEGKQVSLADYRERGRVAVSECAGES